MKVRDITAAIEEFAPLGLQESYDNSGLVVGRMDDEVNKALLAVDVTEEVIEEALAELDALVGLDSVKEEVRKLANMAKIVEQRKKAGLKVAPISYVHQNLPMKLAKKSKTRLIFNKNHSTRPQKDNNFQKKE